MIMKKNNRFFNSDLIDEWNWEKNNILGLSPENISNSSNEKVWWKCRVCNNEWMATISHRTSKNKPTGCPRCARIKRGKERHLNNIKNKNIALLFPSLLDDWDYNRNILLPEEVTKGTKGLFWWKCKEGHSWKTAIYARATGHGCPYCKGRLAIKGENDLETVVPDLAKEWNYEKNDGLTPDMVKSYSNKKVWWICRYGHEWVASINNRHQKRGCPICSQYMRVSLPEKAIFYYLAQVVAVEQNKKLSGINAELDLFIPSLNLAIEYDGKAWHKNVERDLKKDNYCFNNGINIVRIREEGTPFYNSIAKFIYTTEPDNNLIYMQPVIEKVVDYINNTYNTNFCLEICLERDYNSILSQIRKYNNQKSLAKMFPKLLKEWNYYKNGELNPEFVFAGSSKKVWWICEKGHEWRTTISNRTNASNKNLCPYCQRKKTIVGENDIVSLGCEFLKDWDYSKNQIEPNQYMKNSGKKVWWKCAECGFEWQATIDQRSKAGCKYCGRKRGADKRRRMVLNVDTQEVFTSAKEAAQKYQIRYSTICRVCRGERKTGGGYRWEYILNNKED